MKLAIHSQKGSFSDRWIIYCERQNIPFKLVNCYDNDIIQQLEDCDALLWHHQQTNYKDVLLAKNILFAIEQYGKTVFPNFNTGWHFDNKVAQKYLLESVDAPMVPSYAFYDRKTAIEWVQQSTFPKVFKLKGGSGSGNVKLAKTSQQALRLIDKAFRSGFSQSDSWGNLKERYRQVRTGRKPLRHLLNGLGRLIISTEYDRMHGKEKGYVYFQDFIPNNSFDIRVIVIGSKAFALKRLVRENDFRASGSGKIIYEPNEIDIRCVSIAFEVNSKLKTQCIAYDFIFDQNDNPLIVEISYGFSVLAYDNCPGYWDEQLSWHEGAFNPQFWMIENIIEKSS